MLQPRRIDFLTLSQLVKRFAQTRNVRRRHTHHAELTWRGNFSLLLRGHRDVAELAWFVLLLLRVAGLAFVRKRLLNTLLNCLDQ